MGKIIQLGFLAIFLQYSNVLIANTFFEKNNNDSLTLGQAFINLSLTDMYFDTIKVDRIKKIIDFEKNQLAAITDSSFIKNNKNLYHFTYSLWHLGKAKQLFSNKKDTSRVALTQWKNILESAIDHFNKADIGSIEDRMTLNSYFEFIGFTDSSCIQLEKDIHELKDKFTPYFNRNIYPDFQRIFLAEKNFGKFNFDSLKKYTNIFNIPLRSDILDLLPGGQPKYYGKQSKEWQITRTYQLDLALDLISRYLQLNVAANYDSLCKIEFVLYEFDSFKWQLNPENAVNFNNQSVYNEIYKDDFFRNNLDTSASTLLQNKLKRITKPGDCPDSDDRATMGIGPKDKLPPQKYFFPVPAPFPSAYRYVPGFKPALKSMKQVDNHLKVIFENAGYKNHTHYYYVKSGYALTTSLEGITKDGAPLTIDKRWNVTVAGNKKFSLYDIFKSIFFATESDFRIFALVISPGKIAMQASPASIGTIQNLLNNSYTSLPKDIETLVLPQKVLTILVYSFHQDDIGEVPMLDTSKKLSVADHLQKSGLSSLLNN